MGQRERAIPRGEIRRPCRWLCSPPGSLVQWWPTEGENPGTSFAVARLHELTPSVFDLLGTPSACEEGWPVLSMVEVPFHWQRRVSPYQVAWRGCSRHSPPWDALDGTTVLETDLGRSVGKVFADSPTSPCRRPRSTWFTPCVLR